VVALVYWFRTLPGNSPSELAAYLPSEDALVAWVDMNALRSSGILNMVSGTRATEELEYRDFVEQTGFNYRDDLDALGVSIRANREAPEKDFYAIARGSFSWKRIYEYAKAHGAECASGFCHVAGTHPGRYLSFYPLRSDLMALAVTNDPWGALLVARRPGKTRIDAPPHPVWMLVSATALRSNQLLPEGTRSFASALEGADRIAMSLDQRGDHLELAMEADCRSVDDASALLIRLEQTTETLRKWIAREHQTANVADLSGVLTAGEFRREDRRVFGAWPIQRAFVEAVVNGSQQ